MIIRPKTWRQDLQEVQQHDPDWQQHTLVVSHDYLLPTVLNEAAEKGFHGAVTVCRHVFAGGDHCVICGAANTSRNREHSGDRAA